MAEGLDWFCRLTPKESEVLEAYALLHSYKAVAAALGKSRNVVDQQLVSVRKKMGVCSMAEAMYKLAERNARLNGRSIDAVAEYLPPAGSDCRLETVRSRRYPRFGNVLALIACLGPGLAILAAVGWRSVHVGLSIPTPDALEASLVDMRGRTGERSESIRAHLVAELCDHAWRSMWGPDEDHIVSCLTHVAPEIQNAFEWSLRNDPNLATRIVGNGHRLFSRISPLSDWPEMIDDAVSNSPAHGAEYARALCGVAFAHWNDDPQRGFECAKSALTIFESLPGSDWDQANALRHMGLCCSQDRTRRLALYRRALQIFDGIADDRGRAHTMLGIAQAGYEPGSDSAVADHMLWSIRAADLFRALNNEHMLNEAVREIDIAESRLPFSPELRPLQERIRSEYLTLAEARFHQDDIPGQLGFLSKCLRIDVGLSDMAAASRDLEWMMRNPRTAPVDPTDRSLLAGYYEELEHRLKLPVDSNAPYFRFASAGALERGRLLTDEEAVAVGRRFAMVR